MPSSIEDYGLTLHYCQVVYLCSALDVPASVENCGCKDETSGAKGEGGMRYVFSIIYIKVSAASFPLLNSEYYSAKSFAQSPLLRERASVIFAARRNKRALSLSLTLSLCSHRGHRCPSIKYPTDILASALPYTFTGPPNFYIARGTPHCRCKYSRLK